MAYNNTRGGMCRSPFGLRLVDGVPVSNRRLDKIEVITSILNGNTPHEYGIYSEMLCKAIHCYWYWGLGKNGCTDTKWIDAFDYLFVARSNMQDTWGDRVQRYTEDMPDGTRVKHVEILSEDDMKIRCFDVHYHLLNLDSVLPLSTFMSWLEKERKSILEANRAQVEIYMEAQRVREFNRMPAGSQMLFSFKFHDFINTLSRPESLSQLEELVMFPLPRVRQHKPRLARPKLLSWRRPKGLPTRTLHVGTLSKRSLCEEVHVGNTDNSIGSFVGGLSPLQAA